MPAFGGAKLPRACATAKRFLPATLSRLLFSQPELANRMKIFAATTASVALFVIASARADLTIVQKVDAGGQSGSATVKIKGDMERIDAPEHPTRILEGKN